MQEVSLRELFIAGLPASLLWEGAVSIPEMCATGITPPDILQAVFTGDIPLSLFLFGIVFFLICGLVAVACLVAAWFIVRQMRFRDRRVGEGFYVLAPGFVLVVALSLIVGEFDPGGMLEVWGFFSLLPLLHVLSLRALARWRRGRADSRS